MPRTVGLLFIRVYMVRVCVVLGVFEMVVGKRGFSDDGSSLAIFLVPVPVTTVNGGQQLAATTSDVVHGPMRRCMVDLFYLIFPGIHTHTRLAQYGVPDSAELYQGSMGVPSFTSGLFTRGLGKTSPGGEGCPRPASSCARRSRSAGTVYRPQSASRISRGRPG